MKKNFWTTLLAVALIGDMIGIQLGVKTIQLVCKPLIIPAIIGLFNSQAYQVLKGINKWVVAALVFSLAGDVLLMFEDKNSLFFLFGLSAFLLAHVCYIIYFNQVRIKENIKINPWLLLPVAIYYAVLIAFLFPYLGAMKIPVMIYGMVISFMFLIAMHMLLIKKRQGGGLMMIGAMLFVISDSLLAINKFYQPFNFANILVILTYGFAQFYIVSGAIDYNNSASENKAVG